MMVSSARTADIALYVCGNSMNLASMARQDDLV
jgi:hypothetical protein